MSEPKIWTPEPRRRPTTAQAQVPADDPRWKQLREPFPPSQIGHKPQPWCQACSRSQSRVCDNHQKRVCRVCGQTMTTAHIDLDYVGHAAVTQRLLEVDPLYEWRFMTRSEIEEGNFPNPGDDGMWIWLTVLGKTVPGLGETEGGRLTGANRIKACMSDGIKNAAMRLGVAIQTWSKEDLSAEAALAAEKADEQVQQEREAQQEPDIEEGLRRINATTTLEQLQVIYDAARKNNAYRGRIKDALTAKRKEITEKAKAAEATPDENPGEAATPEGTDPS